MTLLELAERCEQASGPDRELDREIAVASGQYITKRGREGQLAHTSAPNQFGYSCPAYTASPDAAMTLVPEGFVPFFDWHHKLSDAAGVVSYEAYVQRIADARTFGAGEAISYSLALCAAALKARAASVDTQETSADA